MLCVNHWILLYIPAVLPGRSLQWVLKSTQTAEVQTDYQLTYFIITMSSHSWEPHSLLYSFKKQPKGRTDTHHPTSHSYSSFIPPATCNQPLLTDLQPKGLFSLLTVLGTWGHFPEQFGDMKRETQSATDERNEGRGIRATHFCLLCSGVKRCTSIDMNFLAARGRYRAQATSLVYFRSLTLLIRPAQF